MKFRIIKRDPAFSWILPLILFRLTLHAFASIYTDEKILKKTDFFVIFSLKVKHQYILNFNYYELFNDLHYVTASTGCSYGKSD